MEPRDIDIPDCDLSRLKKLLHVGISFKGKDREYLESLERELDRTHVVAPTAIPSDVVTMNSCVRLKDVEMGEEKVYTLVFPSEADIKANKISILAPIGTAILGYKAGDLIEWPVPAGVKTLRIETVLYQPEAAGRYDL